MLFFTQQPQQCVVRCQSPLVHHPVVAIASHHVVLARESPRVPPPRAGVGVERRARATQHNCCLSCRTGGVA